MSTTEQSIDVEAPITAVYDQWTQFESFPSFMNVIEDVRQIDDRHLHFRAKVAGVEREWDSEITEQNPEERVAWKNTSGATHAGVVTFHKLDEQKTRVTLQLDLEPEGFVEKAADVTGFVDRAAKNDLKQFKDFIEERGRAEGGWRGEVPREG